MLLRTLSRRAGAVLSALVALACLSYLVDFGWLRWRFAQHAEPFGQVTVHYYFAVPRKDGKQEFMDDEPRTQTCVKSLYPHSAVPPCWYLERNRDRRIDL